MTHRNRFGMFIHWGIYAAAQLHEQAMARYGIPRTEYEALAEKFDPVRFDPEEWVLLAKNAGMTYICFTAKHHDGFCMWDTRYSDYRITRTPYGKDVLKMLSEACRKHGVKLSLYYSVPDWHHPQGYNPKSSHQWCAVNREKPDFEIYKTYIKNQITELLTNYGPIYTLFWDIPPKVEDKSFNELVRRLQPGILINNRGFDEGDFSTPEREYQTDSILGRYPAMVEACNSIGTQSWGYRAEEDFYTYRHLMSAIDKTMARGGSYLLNIGPRADGTLDPVFAERIRRIGSWYTRMEGCLEEHEEDPFDYQVHKSGAYLVTKKDGKTYFHFYNGVRATAVALGNWPGLPRKVRLMNTGKELPFGIRVLPDYFNGKTGLAERKFLHIRDIPADDLADEPIVVEISW